MDAIESKMAELIDRLIAKTGEGKVEWETAVQPGAYRAIFPNEVVTVAADPDDYPNDPAGDGRYTLIIRDAEGETIEVADTADYPELHEGDYDGIARRLPALYAAARRRALRSADRIDKLLQRLATA